MSETHADPGRPSPRRLLLIAVIMLGFALLTWGVSLFLKGPTTVSSTGTNWPLIFIPAWLTLTISTVVISFWFAKRILTAEKYRDSESPPQGGQSHAH